jgi:hypothetical protein
MLRLRCDYEIVGELGLVEGIEYRPKITTYLSAQLSKMPAWSPLKDRGSFEHIIPVPDGKPFIRLGDNLSIWLHSDVKNDSGEWTTNQSGSNAIPLRSLLQGEGKRQFEVDLMHWNAFDRRTNTAPVTARLRITAHPTDLSACPQPFLPKQKYDFVEDNQQHMIGSLTNFLQKANAVYSGFDSTYDSIRYLHLPLYQWCRFQLPAQTFAALRADERSSETWWKQAANIALRTHYTDARSVAEARELFLREKDPNTTMTVYAKMIGGTVNRVSTYLADEVYTNGTTQSVDRETVRSVGDGFISRCNKRKQLHRRRPTQPVEASFDMMRLGAGSQVLPAGKTASRIPVEAFSCGQIRWARDPKNGVQGTGDCEDVTCEAGILDHEMRTGKYSDPVLQKLNAVRQHYVYIQTLAGVRGQQLSDAEKARVSDSEHADLGGHLFGTLMPVRQLLEMHGRYNRARPSYEGLDARVGPEGLKTVWVENTGLMEPSGDPAYLKKAEHLRYLTADSDRLFTRCKIMQMTSRKSPNAFIKAVNSGAITDLADAHGSIEHMFLSQQPDGRWTIGADFLDMANGRANVASYAMPEFEEDEILTVKSILRDRMPIPAYPDPTHDAAAGQPVNEMLETVRRFTADLKRRPGTNTEKVDVVQLYPNVTSDFVQALRKHIASRPGIISYEYFDDNLGPGIGAFTHRFEVSLGH